MRELLSNNSLFAGQLFEDKSFTLRAHDLIFSTTVLQELELIYFLNKAKLGANLVKYVYKEA